MRANTRHLTNHKLTVPILLTTMLGTLLLGMLTGLLSGSMKGYGSFVVPPLMPPDIVFPIVWSVLYLMIGLSLFFLIRYQPYTAELKNTKSTAITLWSIQLAFNLCWPFAFFTLELYAFAFIWLLILASVNLALIIVAFRVSAPAAWLLIPYQLWLIFACYLNLFISLY